MIGWRGVARDPRGLGDGLGFGAWGTARCSRTIARDEARRLDLCLPLLVVAARVSERD